MAEPLQRAALAALLETDPETKSGRVRRLARDLDAGRLDETSREPVRSIPVPGRPDRPLLVPPQEVPRRRLGSTSGRIALLHAVAHIEFNAINLALDAVYRFDGLPEAYYRDWISVAVDEARHFGLLADRLTQLGAAYGDCTAHNGLWEMALATEDSCLERMALVPRVLEARGLDVTPGMIERVRAAGDADTVSILEIILEEEVRHVAIGTRWFRWCCEARGADPDRTFEALMTGLRRGRVKGPLNEGARARAGFSRHEMALLQRLADRS